uniref:SAP domain-containing protein n=1 Tax=Elaeophora elaphi TaxID=1147741 RepID=A0A0R3S6H2_9BILA
MDRTHAESCKTNSGEKLISSLPMEFHVFLKHLKKLNYNHKPDYNLLQSLLKQILKKEGHSLIDPYDWESYGQETSKFSSHSTHLMKSKATDEKLINVSLLLKEEDEEAASLVNGVSRSDDTLQKLDELK